MRANGEETAESGRALKKKPRDLKSLVLEAPGEYKKLIFEIRGDSKTIVDWVNGHAKLKMWESTFATAHNLLRKWWGRWS